MAAVAHAADHQPSRRTRHAMPRVVPQQLGRTDGDADRPALRVGVVGPGRAVFTQGNALASRFQLVLAVHRRFA